VTNILQDKAALVTGAGDGIGRAIAAHLAAAGARVAVLDFRDDSARETCRQIQQQGQTALALSTDVRDAAAVRSAIDSVEREFGGLQILVNNAGLAVKKMFEQMTPTDWQEVWDTNLSGTLNCIRTALPLLKKQPGSKILNIASVEVFSHSRKLSAYSASKGAVASLSRTLALELAAYKINVNYVCPGFIRTEMTRRYWQKWLFRKYVERITPLGRMGEPDDVARLAVFLTSPDSDFITGQGFVVDGGLTLRSL
jgi:NAD(P)-dependent dehydrogenase (short-subunit alcohol dehydrogenase family)